MQRDRENSKARSEELIRAHAQERAQKQAAMDAKISGMEEKIERLNNLLIENGMMNQNPMPEERPETSTYFFTRPAP
jgi:TolA-binding protein